MSVKAYLSTKGALRVAMKGQRKPFIQCDVITAYPGKLEYYVRICYHALNARTTRFVLIIYYGESIEKAIHAVSVATTRMLLDEGFADEKVSLCLIDVRAEIPKVLRSMIEKNISADDLKFYKSIIQDYKYLCQ